MLTLVLYIDRGDIIEYNFFPEGKEEYGTISVNKTTGDIEVIKKANGDYYAIYLRHAVSQVSKYQKSGVYKKKTTVAWY